ncbi:hypothetical protein FB567DRAFT_608836 [Paraphoma chrysanthemicola]|uniref:CPAF-like PDZ domain-containing protein n=1 Tax=Paraphoma chrysanthemicola TaxID=798071 RepID=A0A8K0QW86_9PLEO|nr:hypothetical protein FB567DRAFT_608836 [Paraphoma chrysanthemicola]
MRLFLLYALTSSIAQARRPEPLHVLPIPERLPASASLFRRQQSVEPCTQISAAWASQRTNATLIIVPAELAYECLQSVPVDVDGDLQEIEELKEYLQYQSTLAYLKAGVPGQIEPFDVIRSLDQIANGVRNGSYASDYEVQLSIRALLDRAGDFHLYYIPDLTTIFSFRRREGSLISLSSDALQVPQLFPRNDMLRQDTTGFTPSAVLSINGRNASEYVESFSSGTNFHNADARYNNALSNPVRAAFRGFDDGFFRSSYMSLKDTPIHLTRALARQPI